MKDWKQVLMGLCKVKSIVTLLLTGTFMALALRGDVIVPGDCELLADDRVGEL